MNKYINMPHAENNFSQHEYNSSLEPCLKKSKLDYSWETKANNNHKDHQEAKEQKWSWSMTSEDRHYESYLEKCRNNEVTRNGSGLKYSSESCRNHSSCGPNNGRECSNVNQQSCDLPNADKCKNSSDVMFSETSTAFIGPIFQPPPEEKYVPETRPSSKAESHTYKITTVDLKKTANRSNSDDGMNYELRQFYKELNDLEAETVDQTDTVKEVHQPTADILQRFSPGIGKTSYPGNIHHSQLQIPTPFNPCQSKPSTTTSIHCNASEMTTSQLERPALNNQASCDKQTVCSRLNATFLSPLQETVPTPGYQHHPPPPPFFIVPYAPPAPRYNGQMTVSRQNYTLPSLYPQTDRYHSDISHRAVTQPPCHYSQLPPSSMISTRDMSYTKPWNRGQNEQPEHQRGEIFAQKDRPFSKPSFPHDMSYEHCSGTYLDHSSCKNSKRKLVILRGVPGSGKSTLARNLLDQSPDGIIFNTDDYFCHENGYTYEVKLLGDAHNWNQNRARRAMDEGRSPVIIDNTNTQAWEMKPYVQMALDRGYDVEFREPDTWWKLNPQELERRNTHRVPREKILQMLEKYEHGMSVPVVMNSVAPIRKNNNRPPQEAQPRWGASAHSTTQHTTTDRCSR